MSRRYRILYAEDNPHDADLTRAHFTREAPDFDVEIVDSGHACLERATQAGADLILLDHRLPDVEGLDVLRALVHGGVALPVVLVTGSGDEALVVKALRLGAANYVPKAGDYLQTLPQLLRQVVQEREQRARLGLPAAGPRRILYVEHHPMDIDLTLRHFAEVAPSFTLEVARSCSEALLRLASQPAYDAMLIDLRLPEQSGLDFVREAKQRGLPLPPFIMISGKGDEDAAIASLSLGAADYVAKRDGYLDQLPYTIDRAIAYDRLDRANAQLQAELAERKRVEVELRFRNAILTTQQESTLDGILVVDGKGGIVSSNGRFAEMWDINADILASRVEEPVLQSATEKLVDPDGFLRKVRDLYAHPELKSEDEIAFKDGRTLERYSAPMLSPDREILGRVWYFRDITARKQAEKERLQLEEQLRVSQKMEALGSLAGGVAHDFNNLLSVILSYTDFSVERLPLDAPARDDLLQVRKAATSAATLVQQLLAFSRKQVLQAVPLSLNQSVSGIETILRRVLGENIELVQELAPDLGLTLADPGQIEQVLMNLVGNARDAMPEGGRMTLTTTNLEVDERHAANHGGMPVGPYVLLTVTDTGCGMDESIRSRIFEPFFTTKGPGKGTGLGLPTVFGIVKQSNGSVWVESEPGKGTRFDIYLPRQRSAQVAGAPPAALPRARARAAGMLGLGKSADAASGAAGAMSSAMLERLTQATIAARHDEVCRILDALRPTAPALATALQALADRFDYAGIWQRLRE